MEKQQSKSPGFTQPSELILLSWGPAVVQHLYLQSSLDSFINMGIIQHHRFPLSLHHELLVPQHLVSLRAIVHLLFNLPLIFIAMSMSWPTVSLQSLICRMCSSRTETWRWRSTMSIFTAGAISSRPPRRTPATRGKWVWQRHQHREPELMATQSCRYHYGEHGRDYSTFI